MSDVEPTLHWWRYLRPYRHRLALGAVMLFLTNACALTVPWLLGRTVDAIRGGHSEKLPGLAGAMIGLALAQAVVRVISRLSIFNTARSAEYQLRSDLYAHVIGLDADFFRKHSVGDLLSRFSSDLQTVRAMWGPGFLNLVNTLLIYSVGLFLMLRLSPWLTLWALMPYPLVFFIGNFMGKSIYTVSRGVQEGLGRLSSSIQSDLAAISVVKAYGLEGHRLAAFSGLSENLLRKNLALSLVRGRLNPALTTIAAMGTVAILFAGTQLVIKNEMQLGQLIQFNAYLALLIWPTIALGWMIGTVKRGQASWARISAILALKPAIVGGNAALTKPCKGAISVRNLSISLGDRQILHNISFEIPAGSTLAIVGRTGSGKSTLVEVLPRLIDPPKGTVFLDGIDITELPLEELRQQIGYAPQEAFLFSESIMENIQCGIVPEAGNGHAVQTVKQAAEFAGLESDLEALPHGFATVVGEKGILLSGGQRQRVALARAMARHPSVLVLDDSLSSVDAKTEQAILTGLDRVASGRTAILISHRVSAIRRAQQIIVLEGGRVVQSGTHHKLIAEPGVYAELYETQLSGELLS